MKVRLLLALAIAGGCSKEAPPAPSSSGPAPAATAEEFHRRFREAAIAHDGKTVWFFFSAKSKETFTKGEGLRRFESVQKLPDAELAEWGERFKIDPARVRSMTVEEFYRHLFSYPADGSREREKIEASQFKSVDVRGDTATMITTPDQVWILVKEDGGWKLDVEESDRRNRND